MSLLYSVLKVSRVAYLPSTRIICTTSVRCFNFGGQQQGRRESGVAKRWNFEKGYGFVRLNDGSGDAFVHRSAVQSTGDQSLTEGEDVEFDLSEDNQGRKKAENVTGPNGAPVTGGHDTSGMQGGMGGMSGMRSQQSPFGDNPPKRFGPLRDEDFKFDDDDEWK